jgi:DHA1 family multidrug resistance protein-like MFS transporter
MVARFYYLLGAIFLFSFGTNVPKPIYPHYVLTFTASYITVGSVLAGLGYSRVFIEAPLGMVVDRYGRRRIAIIGSLSLIASALIGGLAPDLIYLVSSVVLSGISSSLFFSSAFGMINDLAPPRRIGGHFGSNIAAIFLGSIFGPFLGGYIASQYGLRVPFIVSSGVAFVALILLLKGTGEANGRATQVEEGSQYGHLDYLRKLGGSKKLIFVNLLGFLNPFTMSCIVSTVLPIFGGETIGLNYAQIGMILSVMSISSFLVSTPSGLLSDKMGRELFLALGFSLYALANLLFPLSTNVLILLIPSILLGLGDGVISPAMWASLSDATTTQETAISIGVFRTFIAAGLIAGPTTAGFVMSSYSVDVIFQLMVLIALLAAVGNIFSFTRRRACARAKKEELKNVRVLEYFT